MEYVAKPEYGNRKGCRVEFHGKVGDVVKEPSPRIVIAEFDDGTRVVSVNGCRFIKEDTSIGIQDLLKKYKRLMKVMKPVVK